MQINLAKAKRLLSVLNNDNASELLNFAKDATFRQIEAKVAGIKPRSVPRTRITHVTEDLVKLTTCFDLETLKMHDRVKALEAQRGNHGDFQKELYETYLKYRDPVRKAERSKVRKVTIKPANPARAESRRVPLSAAEKHAVFARDQGRCTHVGADGRRCNQDRYIEVHHIVPVGEGGSNDPTNLTTLCGRHHDLAHQPMFEMSEGRASLRRCSGENVRN